MITYDKSPLLCIAELHYDEHAAPSRADIVRRLWRFAPASCVQSEESFTLLIDLMESAETLLGKMNRNARHSIRHAEKDRFQYDFSCGNDPETLAEFCRFYDAFARSKRLPRVDRKRVSALAQTGALDISRISDPTGQPLVWHAHYRALHRARLIYSASVRTQVTDPSVRTLIGRANRYHTWQDMLRFQRRGITVYDLGGWYPGIQDQEKLGINRFKAGFGAVVVKEFNSETGITTAGRLAVALKARLWNLPGWARTWRPLVDRTWELIGRQPLHSRSPLHGIFSD